LRYRNVSDQSTHRRVVADIKKLKGDLHAKARALVELYVQ